MKFYEKPLAIINKFEVEDIITDSAAVSDGTIAAAEVTAITGDTTNTSQGVIFQW